MKLVVMIPAYNEEKSIGLIIEKIKKASFSGKSQILVIDDGSQDSTVKVSRERGADRIISNGNNRGLGFTFQRGIDEAIRMGAEIIVNIDADGQFNPLDIPKLIEPIKSNNADMVTCSRFLDIDNIPKMPFLKRTGNRIFTFLVNRLVRGKYTDTQCGFRAYSREAALRMNLIGEFTYTQEVFLELAEKKMRIIEVPLKVRGVREFGKSKMLRSVSSYSLNSLLIMVRVFRDYHPLKFFGFPGILTILVGAIFGIFLTTNYKPYPFEWLTPFWSLLFILGGGFLVTLALIADMNKRQRHLEEKILYDLRTRKDGK